MLSNEFSFELIAHDNKARLGRIFTSRGIIDTPAFMPVGTQGTVKGVFTEDIISTGTQIILGNTYHLLLRPGIEILNKSLFKDLRLSKNKIKIISFDDLTVKICKKYKASIIIRGLRAVSDFEYEFQLAGMNKKLDKSVETIFLMSDIENEIISSKFIKEIGKLKGDLKKFATKSVIKAIKSKFS